MAFPFLLCRLCQIGTTEWRKKQASREAGVEMEMEVEVEMEMESCLRFARGSFCCATQRYRM